MQNILLLGGNGFIGRHLASELSGNFRVRCFDRPGTSAPQDAEFLPGDIASTGDLLAAMSGCDTMIYLVHQTGSSPYFDPDTLSLVRNLELFLQALEAAAARGVRKVVLFSSGGAVYGIPECLPVPESHPHRPISAYGICKSAMERYLEIFCLRRQMEHLIIRPSNPYGPGQNFRLKQGVIGVFLHRIAAGEPVEIWGDGNATKDYLHVRDLARGVRALMEGGCTGAFHIGSGVGTRLMDIVSAIEEATGKRARIEHKPARLNDVPHFVLDISAICAATSWRPEAALVPSLREMLRECAP